MSLYLLDTDMVSLYQYGQPRVCAAVAGRPSSAVAISIMTVEEQLSGWYAELSLSKKAAKLVSSSAGSEYPEDNRSRIGELVFPYQTLRLGLIWCSDTVMSAICPKKTRPLDP